MIGTDAENPLHARIYMNIPFNSVPFKFDSNVQCLAPPNGGIPPHATLIKIKFGVLLFQRIAVNIASNWNKKNAHGLYIPLANATQIHECGSKHVNNLPRLKFAERYSHLSTNTIC